MNTGPLPSLKPQSKFSVASLLILVLLFPLVFFALQVRVDLFAQPANMEQIVTTAARATFEVKCDTEWTGAGWGLEMQGEYYLVTAAHVVEDCQNGEFIAARSQDMSIFKLELVVYVENYWSTNYGTTDLALLKAPKRIPTLRFQSEKAKVGQWVLAAGFPLEADSGPLLNLNEGRITGFDLNDHLVTDAPINGGMSGGPLISSRGEVVGTVYAGDPIDEYENLGYVQPLFERCGVVVDCKDEVARYKVPGTQ